MSDGLTMVTDGSTHEGCGGTYRGSAVMPAGEYGLRCDKCGEKFKSSFTLVGPKGEGLLVTPEVSDHRDEEAARCGATTESEGEEDRGEILKRMKREEGDDPRRIAARLKEFPNSGNTINARILAAEVDRLWQALLEARSWLRRKEPIIAAHKIDAALVHEAVTPDSDVPAGSCTGTGYAASGGLTGGQCGHCEAVLVWEEKITDDGRKVMVVPAHTPEASDG